MPKLIGVAGRKGVGKDSLAAFIRKEYTRIQRENSANLDWLLQNKRYCVIYHLADPLKSAAMEAFGFHSDEVYNEKLKEIPHRYWKITPRHALQVLGAECFREHFGQDFWIRRADLTLREEGFKNTLVIIPDIRFENEAAWIRGRGGLIIHLKKKDTFDEIVVDPHISEFGVQVQSSDYIFQNSRTLLELEEFAKKILLEDIIDSGEIPR